MPEEVPSAVAKVRIQRTTSLEFSTDSVVVEEPLEIRLKQGSKEEQLGITMRTPGADLDLAAGFIWGEGFLTDSSDLLSVKVCADRSLTPRQRANVVIAEISENAGPAPRAMERRFTMTSACGICGSTNIDDLHKRGTKKVESTGFSGSELAQMVNLLEGKQSIFDKTGGLHAALLVDANGVARTIREDVGRHNAVDKVIGSHVMQNQVPLSGWTLIVSGRVGYEIVQKAIVAGISALVGVSAPTSLAIDLAAQFNLTLLAFARNGSAKVYLPLLE